MATNSPTVLKRWIAQHLRRLRVDAGLSRQEVAARLHCALSHVTQIETWRYLPSGLELETMLAAYGVPERTDLFLRLRDAARRGRDWWEAFSGVVPDWFDLFLGLESTAVRIESYDALIVPGILQTPDYAQAIIRGGGDVDENVVARRVELRLARQEILDQDTPPAVWTVLDEAALRRPIGGHHVHQNQLQHLHKLAEQSTVDIQVLPTDTGAHAGLHGTFTILTFPAELGGDQVAYAETRASGYYYEHSDDIASFRATLTRVQADAADPRHSRDLIESICHELQ